MADKEKPIFRDALIMGSLAVAIGVFLLLRYSWDIVASIAYSILRASGVEAVYDRKHLTISMVLLDGRPANFEVLVECSGIVTLGIFAVISTFTVGLFRGRLPIKIGWFLLSLAVGLLWNINRVTLALFVAYNYGIDAFSAVHFLLAPTIDFIWIVSMWALGMSLVKREGSEQR